MYRPGIFHCVFYGVFLLLAAPALGQSLDRPNANPNVYPDPYSPAQNFLKLPSGRIMGSSSAVAVGESEV